MTKQAIEEYYKILDLLQTSNLALNNFKDIKLGAIKSQNEMILKKLLAFGVNNIGDIEE